MRRMAEFAGIAVRTVDPAAIAPALSPNCCDSARRPDYPALTQPVDLPGGLLDQSEMRCVTPAPMIWGSRHNTTDRAKPGRDRETFANDQNNRDDAAIRAGRS